MTQETNSAPKTHTKVLDLINSNATDMESRLSSVESLAILEGDITTFYIDWGTGEIISKSELNPPSGLPANGTVSILQNSDIVTPAGDTLDNYTILKVNAQFRVESGVWQDGQSSTVRSNDTDQYDKGFGLQGYAYQDFIGMRVGDGGVILPFDKYSTSLFTVAATREAVRLELTVIKQDSGDL